LSMPYHSSNYDSLYVIGGDGVIWEGWPYGIPGCRLSSPSVGDLIGDEPGLEIVVGGGGTISPPMNAHIFILSNSGNLLNSFELSTGTGINSSPLIVDLDGDDSLEILIKIQDAICAYNPDGTPVQGFPYALNDSSHSGTLSPTPVVGDPDNDGFLEMAFASCYGEIHYFDTEIPFDPDSTPWQMYKHDEMNRSRLPSTHEPRIKEKRYSHFSILKPHPNPFIDRIFFSKGYFEEPIKLTIYSPAGRRVYGKIIRGKILWDGRNERGLRAGAGIYIAVIEGKNFKAKFRIVKR
jgi:hypothetical protein